MKIKLLIISLLINIHLKAESTFANQLNDLFTGVAENGKPYVVSIISEKSIENRVSPFFFSPFGEEFPELDYKGHSLGSGVIIDSKEGYILTNNHVIQDADEIKVKLYDKHELDAEVVGSDPLSDIAVIRIKGSKLAEAKVGNSDDLKVGEWVIAIGSPFGLHLNHTVTAGIVSARGRSDVISRLNYEDFIQHDAAINPGNSGGALLNLNGQLVGINTAIATGGMSNSNAGVGFAIPINQAMRVAEDLIHSGLVIRGWLGVSIQDIDENMAKALDLEIRDGAIIAQVLKNSPASEGGVKEQDIILKVSGKNVKNASQLKNIISSHRPDENIELLVLRNGFEMELTVNLGSRPDEQDLAEVYKSGVNSYDDLGLMVDDLESNFAREKGIEEDYGVVVMKVKRQSPSNRSNIKPGDVITKIGRNKIMSTQDYHSFIKEYQEGDSILLLIKRDGTSRFVAIEI